MYYFFYVFILFITFDTTTWAMEQTKKDLILQEKIHAIDAETLKIHVELNTKQNCTPWPDASLSAYNALTQRFAYSNLHSPRVDVITLPNFEPQFYTTLLPNDTPGEPGEVAIKALDFSPNGQQLIITLKENIRNSRKKTGIKEIHIIDCSNPEVAYSLNLKSDLVFSEDGSRCAGIDNKKRGNIKYQCASVWKADSLDTPLYTTIAQGYQNILLNHDGSWLILIGLKKISIIEIATKKLRNYLTRSDKPELHQTLSYILDNSLLFVTVAPGIVKVWDLIKKTPFFIEAPKHSSMSIAKSKDVLAIGCQQRINIWNASGKVTIMYANHPMSAITLLALSHNGIILATAHVSNSVRIWHIPSNECFCRILKESPITALHFNAKDTKLYIVMKNSIDIVTFASPSIFELSKKQQDLIKKVYKSRQANSFTNLTSEAEDNTFASLPHALRTSLENDVSAYIPISAYIPNGNCLLN